MPNEAGDSMASVYPKGGDSLPDTPDLSRTHCYECEPAPDPKLILRPFPCVNHQPKMTGADDDGVTTSSGTPPGTGSADGNESNRAACEIVHRSKP